MAGYKMRGTKKSPLRRFSRKPVRKVIRKSNKSLISLIKKVSLKPTETKHTHVIGENGQLYHNVPVLELGHLGTTQSIADNGSGTSSIACRVGDEVIARGLSYKFWFANKLDRPNVMYKIIIFRYQSLQTPTVPAPYYAQGTVNYMIRDLDTESYKILKVVKVNLQTSAQKVVGTDTFYGAEGHKSVSIWIPLKNMKLKYQNGSDKPSFFDIGFSIVAYDSFGTLVSDNIASYAINRKFYFKDP